MTKVTVSASNSKELHNLTSAVSRFVQERHIEETLGDRKITIHPDDLEGWNPQELMDDMVNMSDEINASDVEVAE